MKWVILTITTIVEIVFVTSIKLMHNSTAIIAFLGISLFVGYVFKESREDMPIRPKSMLSGFILGTYITALIISLLAYQKYLLLQ